jgi:hypothetical protein
MIFTLYIYQSLAVVFCVFISVIFYKTTNHWWLSWILLTSLVACVFIPDSIAERNWRETCESAGGIQIYKKDSTEGFYIEDTTQDYIEEMLNKGYSFVETKSESKKNANYVLYSKNNNNYMQVPEATISSNYHIKYIISDYSEYKTKELVIEDKNGFLMSTIRTLYFYGGPFFRKIRELVSPNSKNIDDWLYICPKSSNPTEMILQTIPPKNIKKD